MILSRVRLRIRSCARHAERKTCQSFIYWASIRCWRWWRRLVRSFMTDSLTVGEDEASSELAKLTQQDKIRASLLADVDRQSSMLIG